MPHGWLILELHYSLDCPVVVVDVDCPDHLLSLEVSNPEQDLGDAVAASQLDNLCAGCVLGVHLEAAQLHVGEGHLGVVADQAGVRLQVVAREVHQLRQEVVDGGVVVRGKDGVLF